MPLTPLSGGGLTPMANAGLSDHQVNAYKAVLNLSTPDQRKQMLSQLQSASASDPRAQQLLQGVQGYNVKQAQLGSKDTGLLTKASNAVGGAAGMAYDAFAKPIVDSAQSFGHAVGAGGMAVGYAVQGHHGAQLQADKQAVLNEFNKGRIGQKSGIAGQASDIGPMGQFNGGPITGQQLRQAGSALGTDSLNIASLFPAGKLVKEGLTGKAAIMAAMKQGAVQGAGFGAATGALQTGEMANPTLQDLGTNVATNAAGGAVVGAALPAAGKVVGGLAHGIKDLTKSYGPHLDNILNKTHENVMATLKDQRGSLDLGAKVGQPRDAVGKYASHDALHQPGPDIEAAPKNAAEVSQKIIVLRNDHKQLTSQYARAAEAIRNSPATKTQKTQAMKHLQTSLGKVLNETEQEIKLWKDYGNKNYPVSGQPLTIKTMPQATAPEPPPTRKAFLDRVLGHINNERGSIDLGAEVAPKKEPTPAPTPSKIKDNKFTESIKNSPEVSTETKGMVSGQHEERNTKALVERVKQQIKTEGLDASTNKTLDELSVKSGTTSDETLAKAIEVAKAHDALGTPAGHDMAASIFDQVSEHGVAKGQGSQILSIIARSSPAGLRNKAFRDLKKAGVEVTPEIKKQIQDQIDAIAEMKDGPAKDFAITTLARSVAKHIPKDAIGNGISVWKAGLLSGVKTQGGNLISNIAFAGLKKVSDVVASGVDEAIALSGGKRTKALTMRGTGEGTMQGIKSGIKTLKTGIDPRNITDKYEQHGEINFKSKAIQKIFGDPANLVFRGMQAADQPFYYSAFKNSLYDQAKADGINLDLSGKELLAHMKKLANDPNQKMAAIAEGEADKAVLGYDTFASKAIAGMKQGIDNAPFTPAGKRFGLAVVDVLAAFTKVPSAFLSRTVDFTPIGIGKEAFSQLAHKMEGRGFDQRQFVQAIGDGLTGTGVIYLGLKLSNSGQLSGNYPKDAKEQARWKTEHIIPNAIKIGGTWHSLNYLGPIGLLFNAGKQMDEAMKVGSSGYGEAAFGLLQGITQQSFLQGFTGFSDAIKDPEQNLKKYLNSQIASIIPSWSNDIANATDAWQRQANNPLEAVKGRIPGLRGELAKKQDSFGHDLPQAAGGLNAAFNPLKPSDSKNTDLTNELDRLKNSGSDNFVFLTPDKNITVGNDTVKLTAPQQAAYNRSIGQQTEQAWNDIRQTQDYQDLNDTDKASALRRAASDIMAVQKQKTLNGIGKPEISDKIKLTKRQEQVKAGEFTATDYTIDSSIEPVKKTTKKYRPGGTTRVSGGRKVAFRKVSMPKMKKVKIAKARKFNSHLEASLFKGAKLNKA